MATSVTTGTSVEYGRVESWAEATDYTFAGDAYVVRVTMLHPYKDYANDGDALLAHIDVWNVTAGTSGRYQRVVIPDRRIPSNHAAPPGEEHLRRHTTYTLLNRLLASTAFDVTPSPVYPV